MSRIRKIGLKGKNFLPKRLGNVLGNRGMTLVEVSIAFALLMILMAIFFHCIQLSSNLQARAREQNAIQDSQELLEYQSRGKRESNLEIWTPDTYDFGAFDLVVPRSVYRIDRIDGGTDTFYLYTDVNN